jgi:hypothetical protein
MKRTHIIETEAGKVTVEEGENHVFIRTEPLNVGNITVSLQTVWRDCDTAVSVNGQYMDGAYEAGQWKHRPQYYCTGCETYTNQPGECHGQPRRKLTS